MEVSKPIRSPSYSKTGLVSPGNKAYRAPVEANLESGGHKGEPDLSATRGGVGQDRPFVPLYTDASACFCCGSDGHTAHECPLLAKLRPVQSATPLDPFPLMVVA